MKKAEKKLYDNKAEAITPTGVVVIKPYDGIEVGTRIVNPDIKIIDYMIKNGYWK